MSDIDLLVEFVPGMKIFGNFMKLALFFEDKTGRRVDLLTPESLGQFIARRIMAEVEYHALMRLSENNSIQ